jgi:hypothetical protein
MKTLRKDREGMHTRISHVVMAIAIGGGAISALKDPYLRLPSLYSRNAKPFITTEIRSGAGDNRFSVQ